MDKYNVIDQFDSLEDLELDMRKWINLPFEFRMRSDEECIRQHDCTNITLYNNLKAKFIEDEASLSEAAAFAGMTPEEKVARYERAKQLALSPYIAIISPIGEESSTIENLDISYRKYVLLNDKDKRISNSYSLALWGMNVPNMYQIMLNELRKKQFSSDSEINAYVVTDEVITDESTFLELYKEKVDEMARSFQIRELYDLSRYFSNLECKEPCRKQIMHYIFENRNPDNFEDILPEMCPWYTESAMKDMNQDMKIYNSYQEYRNELAEAINYNRHAPVKDDRMYKLGWSPYADSMTTQEMMEKARLIQKNYLKSEAPAVVSYVNEYKNSTKTYNTYPKAISESEEDEDYLEPIFIANGTGFDYENMLFAISFTGDFNDPFYMFYKNECYKVDGLAALSPNIRNNFTEVAVIMVNHKTVDSIKSSMSSLQQKGALLEYIPKIIHLLLISSVRKEYNAVKRLFYLDIVLMLNNIAGNKFHSNINLIFTGDISSYNPMIGKNVVNDYLYPHKDA